MKQEKKTMILDLSLLFTQKAFINAYSEEEENNFSEYDIKDFIDKTASNNLFNYIMENKIEKIVLCIFEFKNKNTLYYDFLNTIYNKEYEEIIESFSKITKINLIKNLEINISFMDNLNYLYNIIYEINVMSIKNNEYYLSSSIINTLEFIEIDTNMINIEEFNLANNFINRIKVYDNILGITDFNKFNYVNKLKIDLNNPFSIKLILKDMTKKEVIE